MNLSSLRAALTEVGPTVTVWIDDRRGEEGGGHEVQLRWQDLADRLRDLGAPDAEIQALEAAATAPTGLPDPSSRVVAARNGRVILHEVVPAGTPDGVGQVAFESLPDVEPLVAARRTAVGFVVARIDRAGAEVDVFHALNLPAQERAEVKGTTTYIHKFRGGGWSQLRFERSTEHVWHKNAEEVAQLIHEKATEHGVKLLVLGGDQRARTLVTEALPKEPVGQGYEVVEVEGDVRAPGASEDRLDEAVTRAVEARTTHEVESALDRFRAARAPMHDGTVTGTAAVDVDHTVAAFQQGQVAVLLLDPGPLRSRRLVVGPTPYDIAVPGAPRAWDGDDIPVPADLALVRVAVLTDAEVELVTDAAEDLPDGAGALLRWGEAAPQPAGARSGLPLP
jgi:Bacterial archaeo-eukaryotic release factor family 2